MSEDTYGFDYAFQKKIASLLLQSKSFADQVTGVLDPKRIDDAAIRYIISQSLTYYRHRNEIPDVADLRQIVHDDTRIQSAGRDKIVAVLNSVEPVRAEHLILEKIAHFNKHQIIRQTLLDCSTLLNEKRYDTIQDRWNEVFNKDYALMRVKRTSLYDELNDILNPEGPEKVGVPTLIGDLDRYLFGGGLISGNVGVFLAPTRVGKSTALVHVAKVALALLVGEAVLSITLELSKTMYSWKMLSSFGGLTYQQMKEDSEDAEARIRSKWKEKLKRSYVEHFFAHQLSVIQLRQMLKSWSIHGDYPLGMVTVDYADLLDSGRKFGDELRAQRYVYEYLRGISQECEVPIWTACQTNRKGLDKKIVTMKDISEGFGKAQTADIILALCQTDQEKEKNPAEMRAFLAKNRNELDAVTISFKTNYRRQQFVEVDAKYEHDDREPDRSALSGDSTTGDYDDDDDIPF